MSLLVRLFSFSTNNGNGVLLQCDGRCDGRMSQDSTRNGPGRRKGDEVVVYVVKGAPRRQSYVPKKNRIHYSGPLMPPGGNMDEMLKEHERQIQQAVRKARIDKANTKTYGGNGQS